MGFIAHLFSNNLMIIGNIGNWRIVQNEKTIAYFDKMKDARAFVKKKEKETS
jgi:hypothetical protein